jgi:hypothetical protein
MKKVTILFKFGLYQDMETTFDFDKISMKELKSKRFWRNKIEKYIFKATSKLKKSLKNKRSFDADIRRFTPRVIGYQALLLNDVSMRLDEDLIVIENPEYNKKERRKYRKEPRFILSNPV